MKRLFAILMLGNLLFNSFGYFLISMLLEKRANIKTEARLDANEYDNSKLIEIKIPINLPYTTEWKDFERFDGEIELNGIHYQYVKRKVIVDSLVLLCLPNQTKFKFEADRDHFFDLVNGLKHPLEKKSASSIFKNLLTEYLSRDNYWSLIALPDKHAVFYNKDSFLFSLYNPHKLIKPPAYTV